VADDVARPAEIKDAYWQVPISDYVPRGPAPERSIVDEPRRRLELVWDSVVKTMVDETNNPYKNTEARERLDEFEARIDAGVALRRAEAEQQKRRAAQAAAAAAEAAAEARPRSIIAETLTRAARLLVPAALAQKLLPDRG
jgi:hypothetical protein